MQLIHTCYRITDPQRSIAFYEALGLEKRRELSIREEAVNYFLGVPGTDRPELELTYNLETPGGGYDVGTGYGHIALPSTISTGRLPHSPRRVSSRSVRPTPSARVAHGSALSAIPTETAWSQTDGSRLDDRPCTELRVLRSRHARCPRAGG